MIRLLIIMMNILLLPLLIFIVLMQRFGKIMNCCIAADGFWHCRLLVVEMHWGLRFRSGWWRQLGPTADVGW